MHITHKAEADVDPQNRAFVFIAFNANSTFDAESEAGQTKTEADEQQNAIPPTTLRTRSGD